MEIQSLSSSGNGGGANKGTFLVWEDLTVVLPNFGHGPPRRLLQHLNGYAEPGRIMAIMGPSGSGKSTLLDSLAGRLSRNVVLTGDILLNGKKRNLEYGFVAYVTQEDVLLGTLTVRETIRYSALLRFPTTMTKHEVDDVVEGTILELGLQDCSDRAIGNWHMRGISGGEKKRVSIALEILTRPQLLFLDEPTSGLDSASAFFVVQALRNIARDGRTVVSSIHQPSSEVFALFDDLFLLSGGEAVYFGEAKLANEFFTEAGFPCPSRRNLSDHFLRCINSDFDVVTANLKGSQRIQDIPSSSDPLMNLATAQIKASLVQTYKGSKCAKKTKARIREIKATEGLEFEPKLTSEATCWRQLTTLTRRSLVNMSRDVGYYWLRIVIYLILSVCVGTIFWDVGYTYTAILARVACGSFITGFMAFMSIGGFPSFIEEMKVFYKERRNGYYGVSVYILSNFISSFPFLVAISAVTGTITWYMVQFRPGASLSYYAYFCLVILACITVIESLMMVVASLVPNFLMGIITGAGIMKSGVEPFSKDNRARFTCADVTNFLGDGPGKMTRRECIWELEFDRRFVGIGFSKGILMMTSGFFRLLPQLPKPFWRYPVSYMSYGSWAIQGAYKNCLLGLEFDPLVPGDPKMTGAYIITSIFGVSLKRSKWFDLAIIFAILVAYRLLFFFILKLKERASPVIDKLYAKRTLYHLDKRPSFRKTPSLRSNSSRRHHSLSSQEGRNSPLETSNSGRYFGL